VLLLPDRADDRGRSCGLRRTPTKPMNLKI